MSLMEHVQQMLNHAQILHHPTTYANVLLISEQHNVPTKEAFVRFQEQYGGRALLIPTQQYRIDLSLFDQIDDTLTMYAQDEGGRWRVQCGFPHVAVPYALYLDEDGTVYAGSIPIASSFTRWLLAEAVADQMLRLHNTWVTTAYIRLPRRPMHFDISPHIPRIDEACDQYHCWWGNNRIRIEQGISWDDESQDLIRLYARTEHEARQAVQWLPPDVQQHVKEFLHWP